MTGTNETKTTAEILLLDQDKAKRAILDHIAALRTQRSEIDAELERLGARRIRKPRAETKKRGRPVGSRNTAGKNAMPMQNLTQDGLIAAGIPGKNAAWEMDKPPMADGEMGDHD